MKLQRLTPDTAARKDVIELCYHRFEILPWLIALAGLAPGLVGLATLGIVKDMQRDDIGASRSYREVFNHGHINRRRGICRENCHQCLPGLRYLGRSSIGMGGGNDHRRRWQCQQPKW